MDYYSHGIAILESLIGEESAKKVSKDKAQCLSMKCTSESSIENVYEYLNNPENYLVIGDFIPRSDALISGYKKDAEEIFSDHVSSQINDIEDDPHTKQDLSRLSQAIIDSGFDISHNTTMASSSVEHLMVVGAGDGLLLKKLIDQVKPKYLTILVAEWEDWASSFFNVDWVEIWNKYCMDDSLSIYAAQSEHPESLLQVLAFKFTLTLDHGLIFCPEGVSEKTLEVYKKLKSGIVERAIGYTGFSMDEYNMIFNSWQSLQISPKLYSPKNLIERQGTFAVIGSGPSLDKALPILKTIQDKVTIVCCASNYGTLRKAGINVDILCLLERGEFMVEEYQQIVDEFGLPNTKLLASVTTPYQLHSQFADAMVYFRPSLTPISIFAEDPSQVLSNEGPQTVNTGVSFAVDQHPQKILLFGVDLGTADTNKVRSSDAIGVSPRDFPDTIPGNFREIAYTNQLLLDGVRVLEGISMFNSESIEFFNCSDGVQIKGYLPLSLDQVLIEMPTFEPSTTLNSWWESCPHYSFEMFEASFIAAQPRHHIYAALNELTQIIENDFSLESYDLFKRRVTNLLDLESKPRYAQLCSRIIRGNIYRTLISINRQLRIMQDAADPSTVEKFFLCVRKLLLVRVATYRTEIFQLLDMLEFQGS